MRLIRASLLCRPLQGNISINFVCAKTRVAPVKPISIPRLELQAAWLLAQLIRHVAGILKIKSRNILAFSDSKVVLSWIAKPPSNWTIFVRNRVARIIEIVPFEN